MPLNRLRRGFNAAGNARHQRVPEGQTPDQVITERLTAKSVLAKDKPSGHGTRQPKAGASMRNVRA
jgi:hypothetical protein